VVKIFVENLVLKGFLHAGLCGFGGGGSRVQAADPRLGFVSLPVHMLLLHASNLLMPLLSCPLYLRLPPPSLLLQGVSGEEAAKAAWSGASIDLLTLLPSFAAEQKEVDRLLAKHEANYLVA
jgi:hypothetical protein